MHLITCPSCACAAFSTACACPHCGAPLVRSAGLQRTVAALAMGLGLMGCKQDALYGAPATFDSADGVVDADGDGFTVAEGDCDDADAAVNPEATETAGDGVDSNCDGADDT